VLASVSRLVVLVACELGVFCCPFGAVVPLFWFIKSTTKLSSCLIRPLTFCAGLFFTGGGT
jgi:hypothetical protein